jgi:hypothetical protein
MQGFPNEEISKSQIIAMVYAVRHFENVDKDNNEECLDDMCELGFQHMTGTDTAIVAAEEK